MLVVMVAGLGEALDPIFYIDITSYCVHSRDPFSPALQMLARSSFSAYSAITCYDISHMTMVSGC